MLVGYSVKLAMVVVLYIFMYRSNKARDAEQAARGELSEEEEKEAIEKGMLDMTEIDNKGFRYIYKFS
jgi:cbb3-type cytochrome oxidase subunit 3